MSFFLVLPLVTALTPVAVAGPSFGLHAELPTLHSPMARYSGDDVEHGLPLSWGVRADLGFALGEGERALVVALGTRDSRVDIGRVDHDMVDLAFREEMAGGPTVNPFWEAGLGAELLRLQDPDGEDLALHLGPRIFGALGVGLGSKRLQPTLGVRASFTAATGSFDLPSVQQDNQDVERFYMPSVLVLAGTVGLRL